MKNSREEQKTSFDEYEDLTLFADESFDTGDVDLFEFSSEDDSPLTRLKSIILSLDWEINDEILHELTDEVDVLQHQWQDDKVAALYLQGLGKIGRYIQNKGAYAHPNSIKLLLTFYYNFEKIISTENIAEEEVALILKGDIRKFKILQYQINQEERGEEAIGQGHEVELPQDAVTSEEQDYLRSLKASILSLDWEVTNESLEAYNENLNGLNDKISGDKAASVLVQGLRALGDYIAEEKAHAHPESFTLLHNFSEALEQMLETAPGQREDSQVRQLLEDRIGRLNMLKTLIAGRSVEQHDEHLVDDVVDQITSALPYDEEPAAAEEEKVKEDATEAESGDEESLLEDNEELEVDLESELDELFPEDFTPAMETSDTQYPEEVLSPDAIRPIDDSVADDFIESEVSSKRGITPALSSSDEIFGFSDDSEDAESEDQSDLTEQLDKLFADDDDEVPADITDVPDFEEEAFSEPDSDQQVEMEALAGFEPPEDIQESGPDDDAFDIDIESKLDSFFADDEEEEAPEPVAREAAVDDEEEETLAPALTDSDEEHGFSLDESLEELDESPLGDIEEKLDFFFTDDSEEVEPPEEHIAPEQEELAAEEMALIDSLEQEELVTGQDPEASIEERLDFFFDEADEQEEAELALEEELPSVPEEAAAANLTPEDSAAAKDIVISELGALLPGTIRMPDDSNVGQAAELIRQLMNTEQGPEERILTQLLGGVVDQFVHSRFINLASTEKLVNALFTGIHNAEKAAPDVSGVLDTDLDWQKDVVAKIADASQSNLLSAEIAAEIKGEPTSGFKSSGMVDMDQLREVIKSEILQLKEELKKQ